VILFHAFGGGLGHLTRTLAILRACPAVARRARVLASSDLAPLAAPSFPCPVDVVDGRGVAVLGDLVDFVDRYVSTHGIEAVVLDTFPWGLLGEWGAAAPGLPRLLVARALRWDRYATRLGAGRAPLPSRACAIEPLDADYLDALAGAGAVSSVDEPVLLERDPDDEHAAPAVGWVVVHSGPAEERAALVAFARARMAEVGEPPHEPDVIAPGAGVYPAERAIRRYRHVVTGAGYNLAALAAAAPPSRRHHLLPFERRYDDQRARAARLAAGAWRAGDGRGAERVAAWLGAALA
jgi:hypothetical protein